MLRVLVLLALLTQAVSPSAPLPINPSAWALDHASITTADGRPAIEIATGFAFKRDVRLMDGTIDFDVALSPRRSFVYLSFRMQSDTEREEVYLRVHKSGLPDAVQYAPVFQGQSGWQLYHGPGATAAAAFRHTGWTHVRVVVQGRLGAMFVDDMTTPVLVMTNLERDPRPGYIALGAFTDGPVPVARFTNVRVASERVDYDLPTLAAAQAAAAAKIALPPVMTSPATSRAQVVREWHVSRAFGSAVQAEVPALPSAEALGAFQRVDTDAHGLLNLHRHVTLPATGRAAAAVVRITLTAAAAGIRAFDLGFSDMATVFLNGRPIWARDDGFSQDRPRRDGLIGFDQTRLYLPLDAGDNELAVLVSDRFGGWGVMGRLLDATGVAVR